MKKWSEKEYLVFAGTDPSTNANLWVRNHGYTILAAQEVTISGRKRNMLRMRNPWGKNEWRGGFKDGSSELAALETALGGQYKNERGKFWMEYEEFCTLASGVSMSFNQEVRSANATKKREFRPHIKL